MQVRAKQTAAARASAAVVRQPRACQAWGSVTCGRSASTATVPTFQVITTIVVQILLSTWSGQLLGHNDIILVGAGSPLVLGLAGRHKGQG